MTRDRFILLVALLATVAWAGAAFGQATLTFSSPTGAKNVSNGYAMSAAGDQVTLAFSNVTYPATLRIVWDTQNVGSPSANAVTLKFVNSATQPDGTFGTSPTRVRWTLNMPLPGTYYIGAQLIDQVGTVNAWAACTINYTCWFHNCWQSYADGCMDTYAGGSPGEGYATASAGNYLVAKYNQHYAFQAFFGDDPTPGNDGLSDNTDGTRPNHSRPGNDEDGVVMADWLAGKKLVVASVYWRDGAETCTALNEPVELVGFRVANTGKLTDRPTQGGDGFTGAGAAYTAPLVDAGMSAPPAWRMGAPYYDWSAEGGTTAGYYLKGDAGQGAEWYKVSSFDTTTPAKAGQQVEAETATWFCKATDYTPPGTSRPIPAAYDQGGWTSHPRAANGNLLSGSGRFAFSWLVEVSNAHLINSQTAGAADCQATSEPRDSNMTGALDDGWFAKKLDNGLVYAMAHPDVSEVKGLVYSAWKVGTYLNTRAYGRDQSSGQFGPYVYVWKATCNGDCALPLDGCVDVDDLLALAAAFGNSPYDAECDFNYDGNVDVSDLLALAVQWTNCVPGAPF